MARKIPTVQVPATANIPPGNITAAEWQEARAATDVLAALRFDPAHPSYGAVRGDAATNPGATVMAANTAAIQLAADDAKASGGTLVIKGTYWIDDTITMACHVDGAGGTIRVTDNDLAPVILYGTRNSSSDLRYKVAMMPNVIQAGKSALGLGNWGSGVGIEFSNLNSCHITTQQVQGFGTNILLTAWGKGHCYNIYTLGHMDNGKIGLDIYAAGTNGWINENNFYGGRWSINGGEGTNITGARHIRLRQGVTFGVNNNVFHKPSIEGNGPEYHLETAGTSNKYDHARWEASPPKVLLVSPSRDEVFMDGYDSWKIVWTVGAGAVRPAFVRTRAGQISSSSGATKASYAGAHGSGSSPVFAVFDPGTDVLNGDHRDIYRIALSAVYAQFKSAEDAHPRIQIATGNGRISFGNATVEPTAYFGPYGATGITMQGEFLNLGATRIGFFGKAPVVQPAANPDTSGVDLATLETEVNQLKAALRGLGLIAT